MDGRQTARAYSFTDAYRLVQEFREHPVFAFSRIAILGDYDRNFDKTQAIEAFAQEAGRTSAPFWTTSRPSSTCAAHCRASRVAGLIRCET